MACFDVLSERKWKKKKKKTETIFATAGNGNCSTDNNKSDIVRI